MSLSPDICQQIDAWLEKYPPEQKQSGVIYALRIVQEQNDGWLSRDLMDAVADYLEMPKIAVYEAATFYDMYDLKPVGRHKVDVCSNISCMLRGSKKIVEHIERKYDVKVGETTKDGRFTLKEVECLGACVGAPMMQINDRDYHENLTPEKLDNILDELK